MNANSTSMIVNYQLEQALMIYRSSKSYYIESHGIDKKGNLSEGKPLKKDTIWKVFETLSSKNRPVVSGLLPPNLLSLNPSTGDLLWWSPAQMRPLFFVKGLKIPSGKAYCPSLLFRTRGSSLSVYALKTSRRPKESTKIFRAPFHNTSLNGSVCLGGAKRPSAELSVDKRIAHWEHIFFNSKFSHITGNKSPIEGNLNLLWKKLIKTGEPFPRKVLLKTNKTVGEISERI